MNELPLWIQIAGGVALILVGARSIRKGLDRLFGPRLSRYMQRMTDNRIRAFFAGFGVSFLAPSSTTMSVLAVQSVQQGHLTSRPALAVMLGADIGLTAMVVLIAYQVESIWSLLVVVGVVLHQFTRVARTRGTGQVLLGLGFILLGIGTIKVACGGIEPGDDIAKFIELASKHTIPLAILSALLAVAMQSSTATIGLAIGLAAADHEGSALIDLNAGIAVVAGANVGIGLTTLLFGWGHYESRRVALGNLIGKLTIAAIVLACLPWIVQIVSALDGQMAKQVGYAHSGFNILMAIVFLPLVGVVSKLVTAIVPEPPADESDQFAPRYINVGPSGGVSLALGQSMRETMRMAEIVRGMLTDLWKALSTGDARLATTVSERDDQVDLLDQEIKRYLAKLSSEGDGDTALATEQMRQLGYINELETIGDIVDKNLSELVLKKVRNQITFSEEGRAELNDFYEKVVENMLIAETAFATRDRMLAKQLLRHKERIDQYARNLRENHFARLNAGRPATHESTAIHLDILTHLKRINSCVTHVAYAIVQDDSKAE